MNGHVNAAISIFTCLGANENLAVLGPCDYLYAGTTTLATIDNYLYLIDAIVVLGKLGSLFFGVLSDSFGYFDMFTTNRKKQNCSP